MANGSPAQDGWWQWQAYYMHPPITEKSKQSRVTMGMLTWLTTRMKIGVLDDGGAVLVDLQPMMIASKSHLHTPTQCQHSGVIEAEKPIGLHSPNFSLTLTPTSKFYILAHFS